jgi:uncharacterized protein (UPF0548 family)
MITLRAPPADRLAAFVAAQPPDLTYPEVGATRGELPAGYTLDRRREPVGPASAFDRAKTAIDQWQMQRGAGMTVHPIEPPREGLVVALVAKVGLAYATSACKVVYCVDEPDRYGFGYGTLADHPVMGEERFVIERQGDHLIVELVAFSRPSSLLFKLGGPIARRKQLALGAAYIDALRRFVA